MMVLDAVAYAGGLCYDSRLVPGRYGWLLMSNEQVTPTRSELHQMRAQIQLALRGTELLRQKQQALLQELLSSAGAVLAEAKVLEAEAAAARRSLALATALDGPEVVGSLGLARQQQLDVPVSTTRVMGVTVLRMRPPSLVRTPNDRPHWPVHSSPRLDNVALAFEAELETLLEVANRELRLRRLAEAIRQTTRRVNALDHILIPRLRSQLRTIELSLAEREREDVYRLKRVKAHHQRRSALAGHEEAQA